MKTLQKKKKMYGLFWLKEITGGKLITEYDANFIMV